MRQKVALMNELTLLEADLSQLAIDLGLYGDGGERRDSSEAHECLIDLAHADLRRADWLNVLRRSLLRGAVRPEKAPGAVLKRL